MTQRLAAALRPDSCRGAPYQPPFLIPKRLFDICLKEAHEFPFQVTQPVHDSRFNMLPKLRVLNLSCQTRELWIQLFEVLLLFVSPVDLVGGARVLYPGNGPDSHGGIVHELRMSVCSSQHVHRIHDC